MGVDAGAAEVALRERDRRTEGQDKVLDREVGERPGCQVRAHLLQLPDDAEQNGHVVCYHRIVQVHAQQLLRLLHQGKPQSEGHQLHEDS